MPRGTFPCREGAWGAACSPKSAPAPPPAHGHRGAGYPRAAGGGDGAGMLQLGPAHRCAALSPGLAGARAVGTARPAAHGGPGPAAPAPACREGLGLCLEKRWRLSTALPGATALATQTNPARSAEPLGHPHLPKSAFHFPDLPALSLTLSSGLGGSSPAVLLPCPGLTEHSRTGETGEKRAGVMPECGSLRVPRGSGLPPSPRQRRGCAGAIPEASRCWHMAGWLPITSSLPAGMHRAQPVMPAHPAAL